MITLAQLDKDLESIQKPRFFDTYALPLFMMIYAYKSKGMGRAARRILFASGIYMGYRNYTVYKETYHKLQTLLTRQAGV